jgi:hypothetical protein
LSYHCLKADGFGLPLRLAKEKQQISETLQGVDLSIVGTPLLIKILHLKTRDFNSTQKLMPKFKKNITAFQ